MTQVDNEIHKYNAGWSFDGISEKFETHVAKSVPFYDIGHDLICKYSDFFLKSDSLVYDIGCSTGLLMKRLLKWNERKQELRVIGIDPVEDMVEFAKSQLGDNQSALVLCENALLSELDKADVIICYYSLQFMPPRVRQDMVIKVYNALNWGGGFFMFEKVRAPDARFQDYATQIYNDFKIDNGLDGNEIINKTRSLKGVLEPFSTQGNLDLLARAGFEDVSSIMKYVCFEGFLAIK
jgi:tRNA (cmo5U34)-methyltransferase